MTNFRNTSPDMALNATEKEQVMTSEQILKRLAKMEFPPEKRPMFAVDYPPEEYNPLTNPADTYALIEKYRIRIGEDGGVWFCWLPKDDKALNATPQSESLAMAVCLAVIESEEQRDE